MPRSRVKLKQYGVRVNGVLIRKSFASATEARAWQRAQKTVQDEIRSGTNMPLTPTLLSVHIKDFLDSRRGMASHGHQEAWLGKYVLARPSFKDKYVHELTRAHWRQIFGKTGELVRVHKLANGTHNRVRAAVHKLYEDARREYEPPRALTNPVHDIPPLPEPRKKLPILNDVADMLKYIEAAYQDMFPGYGIFAEIKLNTGLRQGNIMALRWKDWDGDRLWIRLKYTRQGYKPGSKASEDERVLGVNARLYEAMTRYRSRTPYNAPDDFIVTRSDGKPLMDWHVRDAHIRTMKRAGLPYISEHKLRHTYATHYLNSGGSIHDLKLNLFHSTITVTEKYAQSLPSELGRRASIFQVGIETQAVQPASKSRKK